MAVTLITNWKLAVLRAQLDYSERTPTVAMRLDGFVSGSDVNYWSTTIPLDAFGLSNTSEVPDRVKLPPSVVKAVQSKMRRELRDETVLWLRLKPPYGYLGAVPWEDLAADIAVPVLRVPDRLPVATPLGQKWRVGMIVNAPNRASWGARHTRAFIKALRDEFGGGYEVDLFADAHTHDLLFRGHDVVDSSVRVHDPALARSAHERRTTRAQSYPQARPASGLRTFEPSDDPRLMWADWIIDGLRGSAVRALHIASSGVVTPEKQGLAISPDPSQSTGVGSSAFVESADVGTLADRVGASLVSIAAPESRRPDIGARIVADRLGQTRSGATVFSSMRRDPDSQALANLHAFLAAPGVRELPRHRSWFGYIQPDSLQQVLEQPLLRWHTGQEEALTQAANDRGATPLSLEPDEALASSFRDTDDVPVWVASSSRFLEKRYGALNNLISIPGEGKATKYAYDRGASEALHDIQGLLARHIGDA